MPTTGLDTSDAAELAELLQFLGDWLAAGPGPLGASLARFVGNRAYDARNLRDDLERFIFLLGGNDGEPLFQPRPGNTQSVPGRRAHRAGSSRPRGPLRGRQGARARDRTASR